MNLALTHRNVQQINVTEENALVYQREDPASQLVVATVFSVTQQASSLVKSRSLQEKPDVNLILLVLTMQDATIH